MSSAVLCYVGELLRCCVEQTDRFQIRGRDATGPHADRGGARHETADSHRQEAVSCTGLVPLRCPSSTSQHWLSCTLHALARLPTSQAVDDDRARPLNAVSKLHGAGMRSPTPDRGPVEGTKRGPLESGTFCVSPLEICRPTVSSAGMPPSMIALPNTRSIPTLSSAPPSYWAWRAGPRDGCRLD